MRALEEIKDLFDPRGLMNPGKIVRGTRQDDRSLFRFKPGYAAQQLDYRPGLERVERAPRPGRSCASPRIPNKRRV